MSPLRGQSNTRLVNFIDIVIGYGEHDEETDNFGEELDEELPVTRGEKSAKASDISRAPVELPPGEAGGTKGFVVQVNNELS